MNFPRWTGVSGRSCRIIGRPSLFGGAAGSRFLLAQFDEAVDEGIVVNPARCLFKKLEFERAAELRDKIIELKKTTKQ